MFSITKLLVIAAVIVIIYYVFFRGKKSAVNEPERKNDDKKIEENMVECEKCSTFVSQKEAIIKDGKYFCSKECALS